MISTVDIISYRTHEPEAFQSAPEVNGTGFADYLARIQQEPEAQKVSVEGEKPAVAEPAAVDDGPEAVSSANESSDESTAVSNKNSDTEKSNENVKLSAAENSAGKESGKLLKERAHVDSGRAEKVLEEGDALAAPEARPDTRNLKVDAEAERGESALVEAALEGNELPNSAEKGQSSTVENPAEIDLETPVLQAEGAAEALASERKSSEHATDKPRNQANLRLERLVSSKEGAGKDEKPAIELVDLRTKATQNRENSVEAKAEQNLSLNNQVKNAESGFEHSLRQELVVLETSADANESSGLQRTSMADSKAAAELSKALRDGGNAEILKKAQFLLKDSDQGEIRLILKPEKLGEVRIRLNLNEKHIAGRIIVENSSVREAFQENMDLLNRSFREHGFQTDGLDVSVGGRQTGEGARRRREQLGVHPALAAEAFNEQVPRIHIDTDAQNRVSMYV